MIFAAQSVEGIDDYARLAGTEEARTRALRWKVAAVTAAIGIASGASPYVSLIDLACTTSLTAMILEESVAEPGGEVFQPWLERQRSLETHIWSLAIEVFGPEQEQELRLAARAWREAHPELRRVFFVRPLETVRPLTASPTSRTAPPASSASSGSTRSPASIRPCAKSPAAVSSRNGPYSCSSACPPGPLADRGPRQRPGHPPRHRPGAHQRHRGQRERGPSKWRRRIRQPDRRRSARPFRHRTRSNPGRAGKPAAASATWPPPAHRHPRRRRPDVDLAQHDPGDLRRAHETVRGRRTPRARPAQHDIPFPSESSITPRPPTVSPWPPGNSTSSSGTSEPPSILPHSTVAPGCFEAAVGRVQSDTRALLNHAALLAAGLIVLFFVALGITRRLVGSPAPNPPAPPPS